MGGWVANKEFFTFQQDGDINEKVISEILAKDTDRIQVDANCNKITPKIWRKLNDDIFKIKPEISLRIYGYGDLDLKFLDSIPDLQNLSLEVNTIQNEQCLAQLSRLTSLVLFIKEHPDFDFFHSFHSSLKYLYLGTDEAKQAKVDISSITKFKELKQLTLVRQSKNLQNIIPQFKELEELTLSSVGDLNDIRFISEMNSLYKLGLNNCGINNYDSLSCMIGLKCLSMWKASKLQTLDILSEMKGLQFLFLQTVNNPLAFPDISKLEKLRRIILYAVKQIRDFSSVIESQSVKEFAFYEIKNQEPEDFEPILKNRNIEKAYLWSFQTGYRKRMDALMAKYGCVQEYINFLNDSDFIYE